MTTGSSCGINGCISVSVESIGYFDAYIENLTYSDASIEPIGYAEAEIHELGGAEADVEEIDSTPQISVTLICKTAQGDWEFLAVKEGQVIDINGEKIMVRRK